MAVRMEKRNMKLHTCKVAYTSPLSGKKEKEMGPCGRHHKLYPTARKQKQKEAKLSKTKKIQHENKCHIAMKKDDYVQAIEDQGF